MMMMMIYLASSMSARKRSPGIEADFEADSPPLDK